MSGKGPVEKKRKVVLKEALKTQSTTLSEDIFENNGSERKAEQNGDGALMKYKAEKKKRTRLPRRIRDELFELILQKEHELFIDDVTQNGNLRKRMAWNEILLRIITNHPELPLTLGMIRRSWRGVVAKIKTNRNRFKAYCMNTNDSSEIMKHCPFSIGELNVFRWLSKRPGFCCYQSNGTEEVDGGNSTSAHDCAEVSESDHEYESEEHESDVIESGGARRKRKLSQFASSNNEPYSIQMSFTEERMSFMREMKTLLQAMHSVMMRHMQISEQIDQKLAILIANHTNGLHSNQVLESSQYDDEQERINGFNMRVVQTKNAVNSSIPSCFCSSKVKIEK